MSIRIHPEVEDALADGRPVVALETAVVTHGFARPLNVDVSVMMNNLMRSFGTLPAFIAVIDGNLTIGLTPEEIARLAYDESAIKASTRDLGWAKINGVNAGTTVAASLHACALAKPKPIRVLATGGIGGVHRGWTDRPDISADLHALARSPVCVVCAGAKSILDLPATLEGLDSLSVPVIGYQTDSFPQFICKTDPSLPVPFRLDTSREIAEFCGAHWSQLEQSSAVVIAAEVETAIAVDRNEFEVACDGAEREARQRGIDGPARTPFLLNSIAERTGGKTLKANLALLHRNIMIASDVAQAMHDRENLS